VLREDRHVPAELGGALPAGYELIRQALAVAEDAGSVLTL
jgi:hypothetical protein